MFDLSGYKDSDASTTRYIMSFRVREVFCYKGVEYLRVVVHGQSFIYNQIRKMIGLAVTVARNCVRRDAYFPHRVFSRNVKLVVRVVHDFLWCGLAYALVWVRDFCNLRKGVRATDTNLVWSACSLMLADIMIGLDVTMRVLPASNVLPKC